MGREPITCEGGVMKAWKLISTILLFSFLSESASADQCAWITLKQANKALQLLKQGQVIRHFCEPCGEKTWTEEKIVSVASKPEDDKNLSIQVNGKGIDLAYIFIETSPGRWENLASLTGCPTTDVSKILKSAPSTRASTAATDGLVGTWNVTIKVLSSSCSQVKEGRAQSFQWLINIDGNKLSINVLGETSFKKFEGQFDGSTIKVKSEGGSQSQANVTGEFKGNRITGQRIISTTCDGKPATVIENLSASKQN